MKKSNPFPFLLVPFCREYEWGGRRLIDDFGKETKSNCLAETWECSTNATTPSLIGSGIHKGLSLLETLKLHPEYLGLSPTFNDSLFPIIVKFINAKQIMPLRYYKDNYVNNERHNSAERISKFWYVLDSSENSYFLYGFRHKISKKAFISSIEENVIEKYVNKYQINKNDILLIEPNTIHSIGPDTLLLSVEVAEDNVLFPFTQGQLNIDAANEVFLNSTSLPRKQIRVLKFKPGRATESLMSCPFFHVDRILVNSEKTKEMADYSTGINTFQIMVCYSGCGVFENNDDKLFLNFFKGDCIFVPANSKNIKIHGKAEFLRIRC